jgi:hypothetical protein
MTARLLCCTGTNCLIKATGILRYGRSKSVGSNVSHGQGIGKLVNEEKCTFVPRAWYTSADLKNNDAITIR